MWVLVSKLSKLSFNRRPYKSACIIKIIIIIIIIIPQEAGVFFSQPKPKRLFFNAAFCLMATGDFVLWISGQSLYVA
jgi:hypothetical protein